LGVGKIRDPGSAQATERRMPGGGLLESFLPT